MPSNNTGSPGKMGSTLVDHHIDMLRPVFAGLGDGSEASSDLQSTAMEVLGSVKAKLLLAKEKWVTDFVEAGALKLVTGIFARLVAGVSQPTTTDHQLLALECIDLLLNSQFALEHAARNTAVAKALSFDYLNSSVRVSVMALRVLSVVAFHSLEGHWYVIGNG